MVEIRNKRFQPLTLHLADSKRTVHLPPRGKVEVADADVSDEIRKAADKGSVALREQPAAKLAKPSKDASPVAPKASAPADGPDKKERK